VIAAATLVGQWRSLTATAAGSVATDRVFACLPGVSVPILPSPHVSQADIAHVHYNSTPPTSGPHLSFVVAPGVYDDPVPDGLSVHAMEHGHVIVHHARGIPADELANLRRLARRYSRDVVLAPYPNLPSPIALTAWGRIETLDHFDESRVITFIERLRGRYNHGWARPDDCSPRGAQPHTAARVGSAEQFEGGRLAGSVTGLLVDGQRLAGVRLGPVRRPVGDFDSGEGGERIRMQHAVPGSCGDCECVRAGGAGLFDASEPVQRLGQADQGRCLALPVPGLASQV
jgi:Protein of unknown function (DUF3105)